MTEYDLGASTVDAYVKQLADKGVESFRAEDPRKTVQKVENDIIETEPIFVRTAERLAPTGGMPGRLEDFARAGIDVRRILVGDS